MKKLIQSIALIIVLLLGLAACDGSGNKNSSAKSQEQVYKIGISQLMEHKALDDARQGFEEGLKEYGVNAEIEYDNAHGEIATSSTIAEKFVGDKKDLIYSIATPAAQAAHQQHKQQLELQIKHL